MELRPLAGSEKFPWRRSFSSWAKSARADVAEEALSTGAGGYVVKSDAESELLSAIKAVLEGKGSGL